MSQNSCEPSKGQPLEFSVSASFYNTCRKTAVSLVEVVFTCPHFSLHMSQNSSEPVKVHQVWLFNFIKKSLVPGRPGGIVACLEVVNNILREYLQLEFG